MKTQQQRRKNGIMPFQVVVIRGSQSNIKSWIYITVKQYIQDIDCTVSLRA